MQLYTINTGYFKLDGGAMFGVVPKVLWSKTNPADDKNLCPWAMRSLLICLLYTSPSPRDPTKSRMPSSA